MRETSVRVGKKLIDLLDTSMVAEEMTNRDILDAVRYLERYVVEFAVRCGAPPEEVRDYMRRSFL